MTYSEKNSLPVKRTLPIKRSCCRASTVTTWIAPCRVAPHLSPTTVAPLRVRHLRLLAALDPGTLVRPRPSAEWIGGEPRPGCVWGPWGPLHLPPSLRCVVCVASSHCILPAFQIQVQQQGIGHQGQGQKNGTSTSGFFLKLAPDSGNSNSFLSCKFFFCYLSWNQSCLFLFGLFESVILSLCLGVGSTNVMPA